MKWGRLLWIPLVFAFAVASFAQGRRWALVIGIDKYSEPNLVPLQFASDDAKLIAQSLTDLGFERVVTLTSASTDALQTPTRENILARLATIAEQVKPEDTFLFFFAGHGFSDGDECYLTTTNCRINLLEETAISTTLLQRRFEKIRALKRVMIIDACRVATTKDGKRGGANGRDEIVTRKLLQVAQAAPEGKPGMALMWASSLGEPSHEVATFKHGAYSYFLAEGIRTGEAAVNGAVTVDSLGSYINTKIGAWSLQSGVKQSPDFQVIGLPGGTFVLGKPPVQTGGTTVKLVLRGMLEVSSTPSGATVLVDGKEVGKTPYSSQVDLIEAESKTVKVLVRMEGYSTEGAEVTLERGKRTPVALTLAAMAGPTEPGGGSGAVRRNYSQLIAGPLLDVYGYKGLAFGPDGQKLLCPQGIWDFATEAVVGGTVVRWPAGSFRAVGVLAWARRAQVVVVSDGPKAVIWDPDKNVLKKKLEGHTKDIYGVAVSDDGQIVLTASDDNTAIIWNGISGEPLSLLTGHTSAVYSCALGVGGSAAFTGGADSRILKWSRTGTKLAESSVGNLVYCLAVSPDGKTPAAGLIDGSVMLLHTDDLRILRKWQGHSKAARGLAFSPDGLTLLTGGDDGTAGLWTVESGELVRRLTDSVGYPDVMGCTFSPDGKRIAIGGIGWVRIWRLIGG